MPMKISLALGPRGPISRQMAWGCFTTNLATPGLGSVIAGRIVGYFQAGLMLIGFTTTAIFGVRFIVWYLANWNRLLGTQDDPFGAFAEIWLRLRLALLGLGIFLIAWLWALMTSMQIIQSVKKESAPGPMP